jgi:hypothetical protein
MHPLSQLFHELIDHAVPAGNKRGELHALVDQADATLPVVEHVEPEPAHVAEPAKPVLRAKPDGATVA